MQSQKPQHKKMKKILLSVAVLLTTFFAQTTQAQIKVGFINSTELVAQLPETKAADTKVQEYAKELQSSLESQALKLEKEIQDFQKNQKTMTEIMLETKQKEIMSMQQNLQEMEQSANDKLNKKRSEMYQPIIEKVENAINKVAKNNGYTYIMDTSSGSVLYADPSNDVMPLVKKELNVN